MALTAASINRHSMGDLTFHIVNFASVTSAGDTWSSALPNVISAWASGTTSGAGAVDCSFVSSTGVITLTPELIASEVNLFVLSQS